jgi:hypothetical protein
MKPTGTQSRKLAAYIASRKHQLGYLDFQNAAGSDLVVLSSKHQVESVLLGRRLGEIRELALILWGVE